MLIQRFAPAKINLMLHVVGRLPNDYHHLQTLITFVDCGDLLTLKEVNPQDDLIITGEFANSLQGEGLNSVIQAKDWFYRYFDCPKCFFAIELEKNLPIAAGIGGGTSDAAAMIATLIGWHHLELSLRQKQRVVIDSGVLGADVPVCLAFQLGLGSYFWLDGSGTAELPQAFDLKEDLNIILINPGVLVNTAAIFKNLNTCFSKVISPPLLQTKADIFDFLTLTHNDLQEPARQAYPDIPDIAQKVKSLTVDEITVRQSGSGSTYFVVAKNASTIQQLAFQLKKTYPDWWIKFGESLSSITF